MVSPHEKSQMNPLAKPPESETNPTATRRETLTGWWISNAMEEGVFGDDIQLKRADEIRSPSATDSRLSPGMYIET